MAELEQDVATDDPEPPQLMASMFITFEVFIFLLMIPVFIFDIRVKKENRSRDARRTKRLMLAIFVSNSVYQTIFIVVMMSCVHCAATNISIWNYRAIVRGINLLFFIHRAKLAQGMSPILKMKWFTKIFPATIVVGIIMYMLWVTFGGFNLINKEYHCASYIDTDALHWCWDFDELAAGETLIALCVGIIYDLLVTIFLMILFIVPLYRVYNTDIGRMNENQIRQRVRLKRLLLWSIVLALINQLSSILISARLFHSSQWMWFLFLIGKFDPPINVWSSWLMVTRNREYLQRVCCYCCLSAAERRRISEVSAFTDISTGNEQIPRSISFPMSRSQSELIRPHIAT